MTERQLRIIVTAILWGTAPWENASYTADRAASDAEKIFGLFPKDKALRGEGK